MNHYHVLGVPVSASTSAIRTAYRRLALALHPDRAGVEFTAAFQKVAAAYEVLSDPAKRARYDHRLTTSGRRTTPRSTSPRAARREVLARVSGPLRSLVASGILRKVDDERYELRLTGDEALHGGFIVISTSPPNQLSHWITVMPGSRDGDVLTSVVRVAEHRSVLNLRIRIA